MKIFLFITLGTAITYGMYFNLFGEVDRKVSKEELYYYKSLQLAKDVRLLKSQVSSKNFEIEQLKSKNQFYKVKLTAYEKDKHRSIASINESALDELKTKNYGKKVDFDIYKWSEYKLYTVGSNFFKKSNYEKSAHYFLTLLKHYPESKYINEDLLMTTGLSCYKSKKYFQEAIVVFDYLMKKYPKSKLRLQAKLWQGLSFFQLKQNREFVTIIEEFRKKYRNTKEWKILSNYYEKIIVSSENY
jgi:outer membrane protein assembly factor BamD (BamD/ComL family)